MEPLRLPAWAKLNLALDVTGSDGMGYHLLDGVMLQIDLCDDILITPGKDGLIDVSCDDPGIPQGEGNIAHKAARIFFSKTNIDSRGISIRIEKRIPSQAGLGGGSSDAASVLSGLNKMFQTGLSADELARIGLMVGADVPFCLMGGCARARGRGELLEPIAMLPKCFFAVAKPKAGQSTKEAFSLYDNRHSELLRPDVGAMADAIRRGDLSGVGSAMRNVFEELCDIPEVGAIKALMLECGALGAVMTGTGTAVSGLFADRNAAARCAARLSDAEIWAAVAGIIIE